MQVVLVVVARAWGAHLFCLHGTRLRHREGGHGLTAVRSAVRMQRD